MLDQAIQSLKGLIAASALVLVVWLLAWPSAVEKLRLYQDAKDVTAWLELRARFNEFSEQVFQREADAILEEEERDAADRQGGATISVPLELELHWPKVRKCQLRLIPALREISGKFRGAMTNHARFYTVESDVSELPFSEYLIAFTANNDCQVVPKAGFRLGEFSYSERRPFYQDVRSAARPRSWDRIAPYLGKYGFREHPFHLKADHPGLIGLRTDNDPFSASDGVELLGINLSVGTFFAAIGIILGGIAFGMIGPLIALGNSKGRPRETVWIFTANTSGGVALKIVEGIIIVAGFAWALSPLAILVLQFRSGIDPKEVGILWLTIGACGLVFATVVFAMSTIELMRCRRRQGGS